MDTRRSHRQMFIAGVRGIPPLTDMISVSTTTSTRNNGARRFFQPILTNYDAIGPLVSVSKSMQPAVEVLEVSMTQIGTTELIPSGLSTVLALATLPPYGGIKPLSRPV